MSTDAECDRLRNEQQRMPTRRTTGIRNGGETEPELNGASGGRHPESRLGRDAHGLPHRVDRWPARPGDAPSVWEPTRASQEYSPVRAKRIHALGNACVPQCIQIVADRIRERLA